MLLISRGRTPPEKFQDDVTRRATVSERNGARSSSTSVLFSLAQVVYSRDKPETGRYVRSIHRPSPCRAPRENLGVGKPLANLVEKWKENEKWRTYARGEGRMVEGVIFERRVYRRISPLPREKICCCEGNLKNYDFIHEPYPIYPREERRPATIQSLESFHLPRNSTGTNRATLLQRFISPLPNR